MRIAALLFTLSLLTSGLALGQMHDHQEPPRRISVSGEGIVRVEPDIAIVRFGIVTVDDDPEVARRRNAEAAASAMNAVRELGIEERFIRLENLRLQPRREWVDDRRRYEERGLEAVREVVVEVHDLEKLPELVARVVQRGANRLNQIAYDVRDREAPRNEALREAVTKAREKARLIAETLGETLGRIEQVSEQMYDFPRPVYRAEAMEMASRDAAAEPDAFAAGELEVRVSVHAVFAINGQ